MYYLLSIELKSVIVEWKCETQMHLNVNHAQKNLKVFKTTS
jgi:hypothetical protein